MWSPAEEIYGQRTRHARFGWVVFLSLTAEISEDANASTER